MTPIAQRNLEIARNRREKQNTDRYARFMAQHVPPGYKGLMMSKSVMAHQGLTRGMLDYQIVKGPDGKPVETGNMILGMIREDEVVFDQREREAENEQRMTSAVAGLEEAQNQLKGRAKNTASTLGLDGMK